MANEFSTSAANKMLDWILNTGSPTRPTTVYAALGTGSSSTALTGELSGNGYARQAITFNAAASRATTNSAEISFGPNITSDWGIVSHGALYDALSGGNCIAAGSLDAAKTFSVGDSAVFSAGDFDVTFSAYSD